VGNPTGRKDTAHSVAAYEKADFSAEVRPGRHGCPFHWRADSFPAKAHQVARHLQAGIAVFKFGYPRRSSPASFPP